MDRDKPHVFDPIPPMPITFPRTGQTSETSYGSSPAFVANSLPRLCQLCRRPENDRLHLDAEKTKDDPEHWG
jgi:hypothetical protein